MSLIRNELDGIYDHLRTFEHYNEKYELYCHTLQAQWNYTEYRPYKGELSLDKRALRQIAPLQGGGQLHAVPGPTHQTASPAALLVCHFFDQHAVKEFFLLGWLRSRTAGRRWLSTSFLQKAEIRCGPLMTFCFYFLAIYVNIYKLKFIKFKRGI